MNSIAVGRSTDTGLHWHAVVDGPPENIEHARDDGLADRRLQRRAGVDDQHAARQTFGAGQGQPSAHFPCDVSNLEIAGHLQHSYRIHECDIQVPILLFANDDIAGQQ